MFLLHLPPPSLNKNATVDLTPMYKHHTCFVVALLFSSPPPPYTHTHKLHKSKKRGAHKCLEGEAIMVVSLSLYSAGSLKSPEEDLARIGVIVIMRKGREKMDCLSLCCRQIGNLRPELSNTEKRRMCNQCQFRHDIACRHVGYSSLHPEIWSLLLPFFYQLLCR